MGGAGRAEAGMSVRDTAPLQPLGPPGEENAPAPAEMEHSYSEAKTDQGPVKDDRLGRLQVPSRDST